MTIDTATQLALLEQAINTGWTLLGGILVFIMQCGFTLVEAGSIRQKSCISVVMKNVIDSAAGALSFWLLGYGIAFGDSFEGIGGSFLKGTFGTSNFFVRNSLLDPSPPGSDDPQPQQYKNWFFQYTFCATAATIVSGALAERCKLEGYVLFSMCMCVFISPVVVHWTWGGGWLCEDFQDFAGSGVVHATGGFAALVSAKICGPRLHRFDAPIMPEKGLRPEISQSFDIQNQITSEGKSTKLGRRLSGSMAITGEEKSGEQFFMQHTVFAANEFAPSNILFVSLGTFILWFGWYGFNAGSTTALVALGDDPSGPTPEMIASRVCVITTLGAASGGLVSWITASRNSTHWEVTEFSNGILAGLVSITAGCNNIDTYHAVITGGIGGMLYLKSKELLEHPKIRIDDVVGAFPVHGVCGIWGCIAVGLFDLDNGWFNGANFTDLLSKQIFGCFCIICWVWGTSIPILLLLSKLNLLRVDKATEILGLDIEFAIQYMPIEALNSMNKNFRERVKNKSAIMDSQRIRVYEEAKQVRRDELEKQNNNNTFLNKLKTRITISKHGGGDKNSRSGTETSPNSVEPSEFAPSVVSSVNLNNMKRQTGSVPANPSPTPISKKNTNSNAGIIDQSPPPSDHDIDSDNNNRIFNTPHLSRRTLESEMEIALKKYIVTSQDPSYLDRTGLGGAGLSMRRKSNLKMTQGGSDFKKSVGSDEGLVGAMNTGTELENMKQIVIKEEVNYAPGTSA